MALSGKIGAVYKADGVSTTFTDDPTTADAAYKRYRITNQAKRYWDDSVAMTVKKNGVTQSVGFTLEYAGGVVVWSSALINTDVVLVSGKYLTITQLATFFDWKLDIDADLKDVTTFASNGWKEQMPVINGWSASAEGYWADGSFLALMGTRIILALYVDYSGADRYEGYIILKKNSIEEPVDDVVKESVDIQGTGPLYFHDI